jgi:hypothetical protein
MMRFNSQRQSLLGGHFLGLATVAMVMSAFQVNAQYPIQNMGSHRLAVDYTAEASGQNITSQNTPSEQSSHRMHLSYAPIPYAGVSLGFGVSQFETEPSQSSTAFRGKFGFSPSLGIRLASPGMVRDALRITLSSDFQYFSSEDKNHLTYSGFLVTPDLGLIVSPYNFFDLHLGGRLQVLDGSMQPASTSASSPFSNETLARGYFGLTLKTPTEGAFLSIDLSMSPETDADWSNGPIESTVRISMGTVLGWKSREPKATPRNPYFPNYKALKDRQEAMSDEMQSD